MVAQKKYPKQLNLSDFSDKSLLILDDDDPLRGRLARAMEKKGFLIKEAKTVAEGLQMVQNSPTSFALVDLRLEDGNGLDVVKELFKNKKVAVVSSVDGSGSNAKDAFILLSEQLKNYGLEVFEKFYLFKETDTVDEMLDSGKNKEQFHRFLKLFLAI